MFTQGLEGITKKKNPNKQSLSFIFPDTYIFLFENPHGHNEPRPTKHVTAKHPGRKCDRKQDLQKYQIILAVEMH